MKKKIAILGSTGSIGKTLLDIVNKNKNFIEVSLLTAHKDYNTLIKQAKKYNVKNLIITDKESFYKIKKKNLNNKFKIFNNFESLKKIFNNKIDYTMSSIVGINGLEPTLKIIKFTRVIAIANKESIICGWSLILKELIKNKTKFMPVDSEHFSLWYGLKNIDLKKIEKIYLTASGGQFLKIPLSNFQKITIKEALKHPNWKMGKKISVDSATLINKIFEVIEAKNIFNIPYNKINILIHPKSYIHAIIKTNDGLIKIIAHETTMKIPIFNSLNLNNKKKIFNKKINISKLNNLSLKGVNTKRYPIIRLLKLIPNNHSLFETVIVSANDILVDLFLKKQIQFNQISKKIFKLINNKEFLKYKKKQPKNVKEIEELNNYVRLKILEKVYKSDHV